MSAKQERLIERWMTRQIMVDKWRKVWKVTAYKPFETTALETHRPNEKLKEVEYHVHIVGKGNVKVSKEVGEYLLGKYSTLLLSEVLFELGIDPKEILENEGDG